MRRTLYLFIEFVFLSVLAFFAILGIICLFSPYCFKFEAVPTEPIQKPVKLIYREVTAYTASFDETDNTPCVGAMPGINFCSPPFPIIATNELPLGTKIKMDGVEYLVADRPN